MGPLEVEMIKPPNLVDGVAKCLDNFVFLDQTHDELYACLSKEMEAYYNVVRANQMAQRLRPPSPDELSGPNEAKVRKAVHDIMRDRRKK